MSVHATVILLTIINVNFLEVRSITRLTEKYIVPEDRSFTCQNQPCLTFNQYANKSDQYFLSNTVFIFHSGFHQLDNSLRLENIQNVSFQGNPTVGPVTVSLGPWVSLSWTNCDHIEMDSLIFNLKSNFEYGLMFSNTYNIHLHSITFSVGDESFVGCSAITSQSSMINISDSTFGGISGQFGAALRLTSSEVTFTGSTSFSNNTAKLGGAIYSVNCTILVLGTTTFMNNTAVLSNTSTGEGISYCNDSYHDHSGMGGAIFGDNSDLIIRSCTTFINNSARTLGGAIVTVNNSTVTIDGSSCFSHISDRGLSSLEGMLFYKNGITVSAVSSLLLYYQYTSNFGTGGAIYAQKSKVNITSTVFLNNFSPGSGGAVHFNHSDVTIHNVTMVSNSGILAGAMRVFNGTIVISGTNYFEENNATRGYGGAVSIAFCVEARLDGENYFNRNVAVNFGGALDVYAVELLVISGINYFKKSTAINGGAVSLYNSTVHICGDSFFENNKASVGGAFEIEGSILTMNGTSAIVFCNNTAQTAGGSIKSSDDSQINLSGDIQFDSNTAENGEGGAMALYDTTKVTLIPPLEARFIKNQASKTGGAIFFADSFSYAQCVANAEPADCFLVINTSYSLLNSTPIALTFINNVADIGGTVLYGGQLDKCRVLFGDSIVVDECGNKINSIQDYSKDSLFEILGNISTIEQDNSSAIIIASSAEIICICSGNSTFECDPNSRYIPKTVMPGQEFTISMIAIGQANSIAVGTVLSKNVNLDNKYRLNPTIQTTSLGCKNFGYRLFIDNYVEFLNVSVLYELSIDGACPGSGVELLLSVLPCPFWFVFSDQEDQCVCEEKLQTVTQHCYIDNQSINRLSNHFWVALDRTPNYLVLHNGSCPLDYCTDTPMNVTPEDPDVQCLTNRTGTLCGVCKESFSLVLGSLHCIPCSNAYLALIIPFALAGIALVSVLFLLRLTVAVGTINGLIFYANVIQANHQAFFPRGTINFFTIFIAWLNFDLGIQTCFYNGLNIYAYSWLQFLFPLYLWFLIVVIIISSNRSQKVAKSLGQNPVAVLDTLLLMSYSKILKAIIVPLSYTKLTYIPSKLDDTVWLYDAFLLYFKDPRHIVLGVFAILTLLFLFLPYTFLLLCGHWLQSKSYWRTLSWINNIKPFMDAYHAPYRKNKRHWIGLFLLTRCALFLTFALNAAGGHGINLLVVCSVIAGLSVIKGRVYESRYNDFLESSFILNLWIFSLATLYVTGEKFYETHRRIQIQHILSSVSVGTAFVCFIGIVTFHTYQRMKETKIFHKLYMCNNRIFRNQSDETKFGEQSLEIITNTSVSLRELLLDDSQ